MKFRRPYIPDLFLNLKDYKGIHIPSIGGKGAALKRYNEFHPPSALGTEAWNRKLRGGPCAPGTYTLKRLAYAVGLSEADRMQLLTGDYMKYGIGEHTLVEYLRYRGATEEIQDFILAELVERRAIARQLNNGKTHTSNQMADPQKLRQLFAAYNRRK